MVNALIINGKISATPNRSCAIFAIWDAAKTNDAG
jgi:hypothetical protein